MDDRHKDSLAMATPFEVDITDGLLQKFFKE
jgi:hypothetical protein